MPTSMTRGFALLFALGLLAGGCAGGDQAAQNDETVGELDGNESCGVIYGTIRYRASLRVEREPAAGAILSFMTPHTKIVIEKTTDESGSFSLRANDTGVALGKSITYNGVTYALGDTIGLSCTSIGYRFAIEPGENGYLEAHEY